MKYITGIHALNLKCKLDTCGDWHQSAIQWAKPVQKESEDTILGDYGIEPGHRIPEHEGTYNVANTIRACLDLLYDRNFAVAQGMNEDYICNSSYDQEVFEMTFKLKDLTYWDEIDQFMSKEYKLKWLEEKRRRGYV